MPSLFKPWITRYVDSNGKRVRKETPGSLPVKERSKTWWGEFSAGGRTRRVSLSRDKQAAQVKLSEMFRKAMRRHDGLDPFAEHLKRPLAEHADDFERYLAAKGNTAKHARITCKRVRTAFDACGFAFIGDVSASALVDWLAAERQAGKLGIATSNYYLRDCKAFCR